MDSIGEIVNLTAAPYGNAQILVSNGARVRSYTVDRRGRARGDATAAPRGHRPAA